MRRYDEPVQVRTRHGRRAAMAVPAGAAAPAGAAVAAARGMDRPADAGAGGAPEQFVWRGRLYVVRDVLSCWVETGAWWCGPAAELVHGTGEETLPAAGSARGDAAGGDERPVADDESVTWRVEASAGRVAGTGVYDLRERATGEWRLVQALD
jgi:hypothetical protein